VRLDGRHFPLRKREAMLPSKFGMAIAEAPISLECDVVRRAKMKKSLRETLKLLNSLKTAKSRDFRDQQYQGLSKTHDFAGEAISLRLGFVGESRRSSKIWKMPQLRRKTLFSS
jgi:hypothetical protein